MVLGGFRSFHVLVLTVTDPRTSHPHVVSSSQCYFERNKQLPNLTPSDSITS